MEVGRVHLVNLQPPIADSKEQSASSVKVGGNEFQSVVEKAVSKEAISKELDAINKWLQSRGTHIKFTLHEQLNEYYVQIVDDETREVVREIPPKKILDIAAKLQEMIGLLIDERR